MPNDVFISCSRLNEAFAQQLDKALRNAGLQTQLSLDNASGAVAPGDSHLMIVVVSSPTLRSAAIQRQIEAATRAGLPMIAAQIGAIKERLEALNQALWVDDHKDQSDENLAAIVAATKTQLEAVKVRAETNQASFVDEATRVYDFFISHSSLDKAHADLLWRALEKRGYKCWIAPESIGPTEDWPTAIERGVKNSKVLALLFNGNSAGSGEVRTELAFAKEYGAKIASVRLEAVPKQYILKYFIWDKQWIAADAAPFPSLVENVAEELEKALKGVNIALAFGPVKKGVRPPDTASTQAANQDLAAALKLTVANKAKRIFGAVTQGANELDAIDQNGRTALHWAALKNEPEIAILILQHGGDADATTSKAETPLHFAARHNAPEIADELLSYGAALEAQDESANTPLHLAATTGATEVARALIDRGANLSAQDWNGSSPLHCAVEADQVEVAQLLIERGANLEAANEEKETPLHVARARCAGLLLGRGANRKALNNRRQTPLDVAVEWDLTDKAQVFRTGETATDKAPTQQSQSVINFDVFICHHLKDARIAETLWKNLQEQGYNCWLAPHSVLKSEEPLNAARRGIMESRALILLKSSNSEDSAQVITELQLADELRLPMLWIDIEKAKTPVLDQFSFRVGSHFDRHFEMLTGGELRVKDIPEVVSNIKQFLATRAGVLPTIEDGEPSDVEIELANRQLVKALMSSSRKKYEKMRDALENGADEFDATDDDGNTVLHWAIMQRDGDALEFLTGRGADMNAENNKGETPLFLLANSNYLF